MSLARHQRLLDATKTDGFARPTPIVAETFEALEIYDRDGLRGRRGDLLPICEAATLDDCLTEACFHVSHKSKLAVRRTDLRTGDVTLHIYGIKKRSTPVYVYADYQTTRLEPLYAEHLHDLRLPGARR